MQLKKVVLDAMAEVTQAAAVRIFTNGEGATVRLNDRVLNLYPFRGQLHAICGDVDPILDYAPHRIAALICQEWAKEMQIGKHYVIIEGEDLKDFNRLVRLTTGTVVSPHARSLMLLTEAGIDLACLLSRKATGVRLRAFVADRVLHKLRRGETVEPEPVAAPQPAPSLADESAPAADVPAEARRPPPS
jgi:hypothetical protein